MERTSLPFDFTSSFFNKSARLLEILSVDPLLRTESDIRQLTSVLSVPPRQEIPFLSAYKGTDQIDFLAREFDLEVAKKGETVYKQGDPGDSFYVIIEGAVQLLVLTPSESGSSSLVADLRAGQSFGELALMQDGLRENSAVVRELTKMMRLNRGAYERVLKVH